MRQFKNKYGFTYSEDEIQNAIDGSSLTFDQYIEAKGLEEYSGHFGEEEAKLYTQYSMYTRPSLETDLAERFPIEKAEEIQHADLGGFLDASEFRFMGGWGGGAGQETRVVDFLNNSYAQYDNIEFKEEDGMDDTVGLYIDGKYVHKFNLAYGQEENQQVFYHIKEWIDKKLGNKQDPQKEVIALADQLDIAFDKIEGSEVRLNWDDLVKEEFTKVFEGTNYEVETADWYRDAITIKNRHGVTRHINLSAGGGKKKIREFILADTEKTSEHVNSEMNLGRDVADRLTNENLNKLHQHGGFTAIGIEGDKYDTWEDLLNGDGHLDSDDADRFVDMIFDEMGIDQGAFWFDEETDLRNKYNTLTEDQMKLIIKQKLEAKAAETQGERMLDITSDYLESVRKGTAVYTGEGKIQTGAFGVMGFQAPTSAPVQIVNIQEVLDLFNKDAITTFDTKDGRDLAKAVYMLKQENLSDKDRDFWLNQAEIAKANLEEGQTVQFIDRRPFLDDGTTPNPNFNKRINVPKSQSEFFQESNPNVVYNEKNLEIVKKEYEENKERLKKLEGKTDYEILEMSYEDNVIDLLSIKSGLKEQVEYSFALVSAAGFGAPPKGFNNKKMSIEEAVSFYQMYGDTGLGEFHDHSIIVDGEELDEEETTRYLERWINRYNKALDTHEVLKVMYLQNIDPILTREETGDAAHYGGMAINSLGAIFGEGDIYHKLYGSTATDISDYTPTVMSEMGMEITAEQDIALDRTFWETVGEGTTGSIGILLEFALANKVTAGIRTAKLFGQGTKSLNNILQGWKANKYNNGRRIISEGAIKTRADKLGMSTVDYMRKYNFSTNKVANVWGKGAALLTEGLIEGAKFAALPSSSGNRLDSFSTGFGFGFMGQVLAPVFGQITEASIAKSLGKEGIAKRPAMAEWLMNNASKLEGTYNLALKGPTSFVVGSEAGHLTMAMTQELLGKDDAFSHYMEENWGDYSNIGQRLISNYVMGITFGLSHYAIPTRVPRGEGQIKIGETSYRWFNDFRQLSDIERVRDEAFYKNWQKIDYVEMISPAGKPVKLTQRNLREMDLTGWKVSKEFNRKLQENGGWEVRDELQIRKGDSKDVIQRKKDLQTRNEETFHIFNNLYKRAKGKYDLLDPIKGQLILERQVKDAKKFYKEFGVEVEVAWGNKETMGDKRASEEWAKDPVTGKENKKKIKLTYNVDAITLGLAPHELGHAGMKIAFGERAGFKSDFLVRMGNIAKELPMGKKSVEVINPTTGEKTMELKEITLYDKMVEMNGKWDVHKNPWENARIAEWEMFSYLAEELAKPENYARLKKVNAFSKYKRLLNENLGKELGYKEFDLKTEAEIVEFFANYIEAVNKGKNHLKIMKDFLTDVINRTKYEQVEQLRDAWGRELKSPEAPTTTLESSVKMNELKAKMDKLVEAKNKNNNKWPSKAMENEFKDTQKEWKELRSLAEQPKTYKKDRSNEEIVGENARITKVVETLLKEHGGSRIKDLPDGPIKDNLITNIRGNNIGVLPKVADAIIAKAKKRKTFEEVPSKEELIREAEVEMLLMIRNYNPKLNDAIGAYLQSKEFGLMRKLETIRKKVVQGGVKGQKVGTDKMKGQFTEQKDFDLKGDYAENPNRLILRNEIFKTGEIKTSKNKKGEEIQTEVIDTKKQKEVIDELHGNFNKLSTQEVIGTNFTNIRDFHARFSGEKPHVMFTATGKKLIDEIIRDPKTGKIDKPNHIGNKWELFHRMVSENNLVEMSGVRAKKGVKGEEGRSIELRTRILNAKNSKGQTYFEYTGKRTKEDATGASVEIRRKVNIPSGPKGREMFLDFLNIEIVKKKIETVKDGEISFETVNEYKWKKGTTNNQKLTADAFLQEVYGRNLQAQEMVTWIKETYKNNPELRQAMSEGQIIARLSAGSSKLFSTKLLEYSPEDISFVKNEMKTEQFSKMLSHYRRTEKTPRDGVIKAFETHFKSLHKKHNISNSDLKTIANQLTKEFQNVFVVGGIRPERLVSKIEKAEKMSNNLDYIDKVAGNQKYEHRVDWADPMNIFEVRHGVSRELTKELIKKWGVEVYETMFLRGESGGSGVGVFESVAGLLSPSGVAGSLRFSLWEGAHQAREQVENVVAELKKEGFKIPKSKLKKRAKYDLQGSKEALLKDIGLFGEKWDLAKFEENWKAAEESKEILKDSAEILRKIYNKGKGTIKANHVRMWVEMHFGPMFGLGKKSASLGLIPNMSPKEMRQMWGSEAKDYVLEHMLPAQNIKGRMYDYIINGGSTKKNLFELSVRDYHTTFIPEKLDKMVNEIAKTEMPDVWLPGMDIMMRYYDMFHSSDFNFGFKNPLFGKNNLKQTYDFHPNLTIKQIESRQQSLGRQYIDALSTLGLNKGAGKLNSENLNHLKNIEKALANGRNPDAKRRGMSTWDFDDTLAITKSGVRARIPNPSGKPKPSRKVIFLAGGAGSGKSNVVKKLNLEKQGFKVVNSDISLEWLKKNSGLPENMNDLTPAQLSALGKLQHQARGIAKRKMMKFKGNADGVVVDGTGGSYKAMEKLVNEFKEKGYDVSMLFVETSLETALARNRARKERSLLDKIVIKNHEAVQGNKQSFTKMFGERFMEVKTDNLKQESPMPKDLIDKMNNFVSSYEKVRLDAEQFALEGKNILDKGGQFDFSEFNVVTEGSKGPFFQKALKRAKKFGNENMFVLTARPPESQMPIYEFLKSQGLEIPLENIKGLGNSTGEAKALWMLEKFAEGYNDMYFADDALANVEAVKSVLKQLDVKYKVQQAKRLDKPVIDAKSKERLSLENVKDVNRLDSESYNNVLYSKKHRVEYEKLVSKWRKDLVKEGMVSKAVDEMFDVVESLNVVDSKKRKYEQLVTKWLATSNIKPKEDAYKIEEAVRLAEKYKEDIFSYKNPNEIIEKYAGKSKSKPIDPKTVKEFSKGKTIVKKHGIVEYEVANTKEGQQMVRDVIDTHFGEKSNPWCLTQKGKDGKLTDQSWRNWENYSDGPKSIVFQNGKLIGFKANHRYWDRMDNPTDAPVITIKEGRVTKKVELVPIGKGKFQEFVMETRTVSKDKKTVKTEYHTTRDMGAETVVAGDYMVENKANGQTVKKTEYRADGTKYNETSFKNGKAVNHKVFNPQGDLLAVNMYGKPFGEMTELQVVKEKGDRIEHMGIETATGIQDIFAESLIGDKIAEVGFQLERNIKLQDLIKTSPEGKIRLNLEKVVKVDPNARVAIEGVRPTTLSRVLKPTGTTLYSEKMSKDFNKILEESFNIKERYTYSEARGKVEGSKKWNVPLVRSWGAEDFMGLTTYAFSGKGKKGEEHKRFFEENLQQPFNRAYNNIHTRKQAISNDYKNLRREFPEVRKMLNEEAVRSFTVDQAIRVYNWTRSGFEVPGISKTDARALNKFVESNPKITAFAENLRNITQLKEGYLKPKDYWLGENITMDMNNVVDRVYRKEALEEFVTNREAIFGKWENGRLVGPNMNKIEAIHGPRHREALENILWRMENGTNRSVGKDSNTNNWMNWVNSATGTIMFFNQKSAMLQTISTLNYVNGSFNNPLRAAQAFANQPQYWKDFMRIINSDMLVQRRAGLKINVEAAELVDRIGGGKDAFSRFRALLLEKGFIPTKWADSFAIASGGATYYRNSIRKYKKQGLSEKEAEARAWEDFTSMTEATQQSSRPDLISMQQASALGRPILAFANTPMQMFRRHKRRVQDIANNRGNMPENILSALYYGFAQTMVFSFLSNAMFAVDNESEDPKDTEFAEKKKSRHANTIADSYLRGMGTGGAAISALKNGLFSFLKESDKGYRADYGNTIIEMLNVSPPIGSKARKLYQSGKSYYYDKDVMQEMGLDINNPAIMAVANVISAVTNVPTDRAVMKMENIRDASMGDFETWERVAMLMGWNKWTIGAEGGPSQKAIQESEQRIDLEKKKEKYNVKTEKEVIKIEKSKEIFNLNKNQQIKILKDLGYSDSQILNMKKEADRVEKILYNFNKNNKKVNNLIQKYPKDVKVNIKKHNYTKFGF